MFCSKCHTHINDDSIKFCSRCGNELNEKERKFSSFKTSINKFNSTFKSTIRSTSSFKKTTNLNTDINSQNISSNIIPTISQENQIGMTHDEQAAYSRQYSNLTKNPIKTHEEQAAYSRQYSNLTKNPIKTHDEQAAYSRQYSNLTKNPNKSHDEQYNYNVRYSFNNKNTVTSDNDYRKYYINENASEIMKGKFSFPALIFGPLYLIYRKMYTYGIILQVLIFILNYFLGSEVSTIVQIAIHFSIASKVNIWYLNHVNKKIQSIKSKNSDKSSSEIVNLCMAEGGTIKFKTFIILLIVIYIMNAIINALYEYNYNNYVEDTNILDNNSTFSNTTGYQYSVPNELIEQVNYDNIQSYTYQDENTSCVFEVEKKLNNQAPIKYLQQENIYYQNSNKSAIYTKESKYLNWYYQSLYENNLHITMYAAKGTDSNTLFTLQTTIYYSDNNSICNSFSEQIINNFKESN